MSRAMLALRCVWGVYTLKIHSHMHSQRHKQAYPCLRIFLQGSPNCEGQDGFLEGMMPLEVTKLERNVRTESREEAFMSSSASTGGFFF